ncbi:MAP3K12-binding inhibitory protein 1 [Gastrophryne carolinensis]
MYVEVILVICSKVCGQKLKEPGRKMPILDHLRACLIEEKEHIVCLKNVESMCHAVDVEEAMNADSEDISHVPDKAVLNASYVTDPTAVQIQAQKAEIDRRIWAFIERKQAEINENNIREFCNVIDSNQENSCARTDAVFTPFPGFKSHVKVSRVVNAYGPQTRNCGFSSGTKVHSLQQDCGNQAVEERLQNIEYHVHLLSGGPVPKDIYQRIKKLEDKILELEGISPEYFLYMKWMLKTR